MRPSVYEDTPSRGQWEECLGHLLSDEEWLRCCTQVREVPFTYRHKLLHFKFLHQLYYTPRRLAKFGAAEHPVCVCCGLADADFLHLAWSYRGI